MVTISTIHYFIIFTVGVHIVDSLECYTCSNISNVVDCTNTSRCQNDQSCFLNFSSNGNRLGCINNQVCGGRPNVASLIGRSVHMSQDLENEQEILSYRETKSQELRAVISERDMNYCFECCSSDICNDNLCKHLKPTACIDDPKVDCALINSKFGICLNIHEAKTMCPKFCGLCSLVDGNWGSWSSWSTCDVTCANGTETRSRLCTNPSPVSGGLDCIGNGNVTRMCNFSPCPIDGNWEDWSTWSSCDVTCGNGTNTRTRACNNPSPAYSGRNCSGKSVEYKTCVNDFCPVDGGWTPWLPWEACSVTCDIGIQRRHRTCSNPVPQHYGHYCFGDTMDVTLCLPGPCANGGWSNWETWSICSVTCGSGIKSRSRTCNNPRPSALGRQCDGDPVQDISCNNDACVTPTIAFVTHNLQSLRVDSRGIFVFTTVTLNIGNGYNSSTGIFTAPSAGSYFFSTQICLTNSIHYYTAFKLVQNGTPIARSTAIGSNERAACYNSDVVAVLRLHDRVWVENESGIGTAFEAFDIWNMFSGSLQHI